MMQHWRERYPEAEWKVLVIPDFFEQYPGIQIDADDLGNEFLFGRDEELFAVEVASVPEDTTHSYAVRILRGGIVLVNPQDPNNEGNGHLWWRIWKAFLVWAQM